jgi:hypothetical protein
MNETNRNGFVHGSQSLASVVTHFLKLIAEAVHIPPGEESRHIQVCLICGIDFL